ncbi:hypothetical protein BDZ91DRAFT_722234 [Kalaharituber pfeilii]|nr:hypothetical protein BDZ91DRAFT_722234 [Kalaharituber pfeilii]
MIIYEFIQLFLRGKTAAQRSFSVHARIHILWSVSDLASAALLIPAWSAERPRQVKQWEEYPEMYDKPARCEIYKAKKLQIANENAEKESNSNTKQKSSQSKEQEIEESGNEFNEKAVDPDVESDEESDNSSVSENVDDEISEKYSIVAMEEEKSDVDIMASPRKPQIKIHTPQPKAKTNKSASIFSTPMPESRKPKRTSVRNQSIIDLDSDFKYDPRGFANGVSPSER